jgi:hypothetical protein
MPTDITTTNTFIGIDDRPVKSVTMEVKLNKHKLIYTLLLTCNTPVVGVQEYAARNVLEWSLFRQPVNTLVRPVYKQ